MEATYCVYMLRCADATLYTGMTNDLAHRLRLHNGGKGAKYTRGRGPVTLVYHEPCRDRAEALRREYAVKRLSRQEKERLIAAATAETFALYGGKERIMPKIVVLDGFTENPGDLSWDAFRDLGDLAVYDRTRIDDPAEAVMRIGDAEIVLTNKTPLPAAVFDACPAMRYVGVLATGYNVVDIAAAKAHGVTVTNIPSYGTEAVAQMAIALLLEITQRVGHHDAAVHAGRWTSCPDWCFTEYPLIELAGKTLGVIGLGRIGQATARIAKALQMRVIAYDAVQTESGAAVADYVPLDTLFAESDVIALHCPLTEETRSIVRKETLAKMKDGVILINNSRGPLVQERDLADALQSGKVYAAALDVVGKEPIEADNPLLSAPNCILTPHISWAAKESRARLMDMAAENLRAYLLGAPIHTVG